MNATALPSREDEGRPSTNRRGDIACQLTSSGEPILVLTASDLMKLQAKRKQARARASDGMEYSTVDPLPARPPPATTPNSTFDALNFVHYVPEPDLACLGKLPCANRRQFRSDEPRRRRSETLLPRGLPARTLQPLLRPPQVRRLFASLCPSSPV